jgi:DNA-binding response OmpR family regulator
MYINLGTAMPHDLDPFAAPISKRRPLVGVTILLVEDSRFCSEAVRLMSLRSGARLRRADCVRSAHRHLAKYRPDLIMVDLGLPDGSGLDLIRDLTAHGVEGQAILAISGDVTETVRQDALRAGAAGFLAKPIGNLKHFQQAVETTLLGGGKMPGFVPLSTKLLPELDQQALMDDLERVRAILETALPLGDSQKMRYCAQFVSSVAQSAQDAELMRAAGQFFQRIDTVSSGARSGQSMLELLRDRLRANSGSVGQSRNVA